MGREAILSPRQREILKQLCAGHQVKTIAFRLQLSEPTVYAQLNRMYEKTGTAGLYALLIWGLQNPASWRTAAPPPTRKGLHEANCSCGAPYCEVMRLGEDKAA